MWQTINEVNKVCVTKLSKEQVQVAKENRPQPMATACAIHCVHVDYFAEHTHMDHLGTFIIKVQFNSEARHRQKK